MLFDLNEIFNYVFLNIEIQYQNIFQMRKFAWLFTFLELYS